MEKLKHLGKERTNRGEPCHILLTIAIQGDEHHEREFIHYTWTDDDGCDEFGSYRLKAGKISEDNPKPSYRPTILPKRKRLQAYPSSNSGEGSKKNGERSGCRPEEAPPCSKASEGTGGEGKKDGCQASGTGIEAKECNSGSLSVFPRAEGYLMHTFGSDPKCFCGRDHSGGDWYGQNGSSDEGECSQKD